jgi:hypothetical protein
MNVFRLLEDSPAVLRFEVIDLKHWQQGYYVRLEAEMIDHSRLFIREYVDEAERRYSYHWQNQKNQLICRWDNAPHHPHLSTFPSHCHKGDVLVQSTVISLDEVLEEIRQAL